MRKTAIFAVALAATLAAFAAFDLTPARATPALAPQTVSAGATNESALAVHGMKGIAALYVADAGAHGRTALDVTLWATNRVEGGWTVYAAQTFADTNAAVRAVAFPGEYVPGDVKIGVGSIGADTAVAAFILSY
jgi:hypothetical protein